MDDDQRLGANSEAAGIISTEREIEVLADNFLSCLLKTAIRADAGILWLFDPSDGRLAPKAAKGHDLSVLRQVRLRPGESLSGKAFEKGQTASYPTPEGSLESMPKMAPTNRELYAAATEGISHPESAVCTPLNVGEKTIGVLALENLRKVHVFSPDDILLLQYAAAALALAIENADLREELQASQAINESNQVKADALSFLAHEMRTPLTSIKGYSTALLMDEASFEPETQREFLRLIDEECDALVNLIHDLLESSMIEAGPLKLERQPILLPSLVKGIVHEIGRHRPQHRFLIEFPRQFPVAEADPGRLAQVMRNLLDNAVKYTPQGGLIVVRGEVRQEEMFISVADQGIGIAPEHLNRLFEKFFRVKSGPNRDTVGSGLGLPIARSIVESHGGRIWAESQLGRGTTFYFTLPLANSIHGAVES